MKNHDQLNEELQDIVIFLSETFEDDKEIINSAINFQRNMILHELITELKKLNKKPIVKI